LVWPKKEFGAEAQRSFNRVGFIEAKANKYTLNIGWCQDEGQQPDQAAKCPKFLGIRQFYGPKEVRFVDFTHIIVNGRAFP
jgi:hypothetical protein